MRFNEKEQAYLLALMETYGPTFDFYYRIDSHMAKDKKRFNETTERVGLLEAVDNGVRFKLTEKIKESLVKDTNTYTEDEMAKAYASIGELEQTEEELWGGVINEN